MLTQRLLAPLDHPFASHAKVRQPSDGGHGQMEAVELVHDRHVEGGGGRAFFLKPMDVEIGVVGPLIGEAVNEIGIAVVGVGTRTVPADTLRSNEARTRA